MNYLSCLRPMSCLHPMSYCHGANVVTWVRGWFVKAVYLAESEDNLYSLAWYSSFYSLALCSSQYESFPAQDTSP
jgi:hypothetical protein